MNECEQLKNEYDSIFLSLPLKLSSSLFDQILATSEEKEEWPHLPNLVQLPRLFTMIESFILDDRSWSGSLCVDSEIDSIQKRLNEITKILQCQKQYGFLFWGHGLRFIQSSVVHLFILLRILIFSLIPDECETLLQASSLDKLMTDLFKIQVFVNSMLPLIKQIHQFMFRSEFRQQKELTKLFFKELSEFMQELPGLQKAKIPKIPKLMEYINVSISLLEQEAQQPFWPSQAQRPSNSKHQTTTNKTEPIPRKLHYFEFKDKVRNNSLDQRKKKLTVTTNETKGQNSSQEKDRSPSLDRSLNISQNANLSRQTLTEKPKTKTSFESSTQRNSKSNRPRVNNSLKKEMKLLKYEEIEKERDSKIKKKPPLKVSVQAGQLSRQIHIDTGIPRGWGIIHEYLQVKILKRKLKKLISF